ncbi:anti-sigma factor [Rhodococcus aetherivorans]|uniref:anti-sigma factor n=1 Tax=Rhodococcus aetherivorans TaxID=191292 RepID=UPI00369F6CB9
MTSEARPGFGDVDRELIDLAVVYALDAVSDAERRDIESRVAEAAPEVAAAFARETAAVRETMAVVSASTATEPPAGLRERLLDAIAAESGPQAPPVAPISLDERRGRRRNFLLAAAAALLVAGGGFAVVAQLQEGTAPTSAQVFAAEDVRTTSGEIEGGGVATVVYSKEADAGVLVMNNVAPPAEGSVYQMWLITPEGPESAGIMDAEAVAPSTTAVLEGVGHSTALAFSIEPPGGSAQPTQIFAQLPLG